jgi:general secretion pathway protein D
MTTWKRTWSGVLGVCLGAALAAHAQQRGGGGFPGFGPFGGANRGGFGSSGTAASQYSPNGTVGNLTITVDPDTGNVTAIGDKATLESLSQVLANLDRPKPQVLIKVVFLEVMHNNSSAIGVEGGWMGSSGTTTGAVANAFGLSGIANAPSNNVLNQFGQPISAFQPMPPGAGLYQILGADFQGTLRAIAQAGKAQLLSRPSIVARDRQPAQIVIGQQVPLITGVNFTTFGNQINTVTYTEVGIILKVTPFITTEGMVQMIISPQTSALDPNLSIPISTGVSAPVIDIRSADTVVTTPDTQTVVIGGLMGASNASSESKIPFLGDIPLLGNLFRSRSKTANKSELLIFLTPHILRTPTEWASMTEKEQKTMLIPKSYSEQELDRFLEKVPVKTQK